MTRRTDAATHGRTGARAAHRRTAMLLVLLCVGASVRQLSAQCPDGSPPPCRGAGGAATRRPAPPLDDRTWIVLPFENVARVPDIDWLKDASVNLLYLDMSKWRDIRVIDDERVADFIREVPEASRGPLTLQSGIAVARRAGAGKLVMGDLLKVGARTQLIAKVYDVRTGQRLRTVRQEAANADSIMPVFGQLARAVLNVEPPSGTSLGTIGTASVGAYQAYIAGVASMNRWDLDSANTQFTRALQLDSGFALAHYKLAVVYGWQTSAGNQNIVRHAAAAQRLGTNLPPRERDLVAGYTAFSTQRYADACAVFATMLRRDSTDVEAWYNLAECSYHDPVVVPVAGDTTRLAFRSSWNTSLRAFQRTLELDPTYHLAFQHIQDALLTTVRGGCRLQGDQATCNPQNTAYQAALARDGDSLVTVPVNLQLDGGAAYNRQVRDAMLQHARSRNLDDARRAAEGWLANGPNETRPRVAYMRILLRQGNVARADSLARAIGGASLSSRTEAVNLQTDRIEIAFKRGRPEEAARLADSLRAATDSVTGVRNVGIITGAMFGRVSPLPPLLDQQIRAPDFVKRYFTSSSLALIGVPQDSVFAHEAAFVQAAGQGQPARALGAVVGSLLWVDPRLRAGSWPATDTANSDPRIVIMSVVATGDTARIRRALVRYDSVAAWLTDEPDNGFALAGAYAHLAIADTAGALVQLRRWRDTTWLKQPIMANLTATLSFAGMMWPKSFLLLGDLAAATGAREEAVQAYRLVAGAWQNADAPLQPAVQRARAALARLGG